MLLDNDKVNVPDFLREFVKRFKNFCHKAPVVLTFKTTPTSVVVHEYHSNEVKVFEFDFTQSVKANIKTIKDWLMENKYPVLIEVQESEYTPGEVDKMVTRGMDVGDALGKKRETPIRWRIEKVIVPRDELFLRNLETQKVYRYKLDMPSVLFLKKIREKLDPFMAWSLFKEKATLLNEIYENFEEERKTN